MQAQTTFTGTPDDLEAALNRVVRPLIDRIRELEIAAGSAKHLYTIKEVAERTGYGVDTIRGFVRDGKQNSKGKTIYLKAKEITNGDYRITPSELDRFIAHF